MGLPFAYCVLIALNPASYIYIPLPTGACPCGPGFPFQVLARSSLWAFHFNRSRKTQTRGMITCYRLATTTPVKYLILPSLKQVLKTTGGTNKGFNSVKK